MSIVSILTKSDSILFTILFCSGRGSIGNTHLVTDKIFSGKLLSDAERDDIEFAIDVMPEIRSNFTKAIVAGIAGA